MTFRIAGLVAPLALLFGAGVASAQRGGGGHGGAHVGGGGAHMSGGAMHVGGAGYRAPVYASGYHTSGYHAPNYGYRGYYGGVGYPYYGYGGLGYGFGLGYGLGYGYGALGYGGLSYGYSPSYYSAAPAIIGTPALGAAYPTDPSLTTGSPAAAVVTLLVPDGAKVWFDGKETPAPGGSVVFTSPLLNPGANAVVNVRARWNESTREMNLNIKAGDKMTVDLRNQ